MKNKLSKSLLIAALAGISYSGKTQALIAKAHVVDANNRPLSACYTLSNPYELMQVGNCTDLKLKLGYNESYTLTISKPGYTTKTIVISTFVEANTKHKVTFDMKLHRRSPIDVPGTIQLAGNIYYDRKIEEYNFKNPQQMSWESSQLSEVKFKANTVDNYVKSDY